MQLSFPLHRLCVCKFHGSRYTKVKASSFISPTLMPDHFGIILLRVLMLPKCVLIQGHWTPNSYATTWLNSMISSVSPFLGSFFHFSPATSIPKSCFVLETFEGGISDQITVSIHIFKQDFSSIRGFCGTLEIWSSKYFTGKTAAFDCNNCYNSFDEQQSTSFLSWRCRGIRCWDKIGKL